MVLHHSSSLSPRHEATEPAGVGSPWSCDSVCDKLSEVTLPFFLEGLDPVKTLVPTRSEHILCWTEGLCKTQTCTWKQTPDGGDREEAPVSLVRPL